MSNRWPRCNTLVLHPSLPSLKYSISNNRIVSFNMRLSSVRISTLEIKSLAINMVLAVQFILKNVQMFLLKHNIEYESIKFRKSSTEQNRSVFSDG